MANREVPFSELIAAVIDNRGKTCPTADSGYPLIATNCIRNELLYPTYEKVRFVSPETYSTWFRGHPRPGDILFVNKATPGRVCLVPDPVDFCIAQDMVAVRANPNKVYPRYLFAVLRSQLAQERIARMHVGSLIPHFKKGDFDKLLLPIPGNDEQQFVGDMYFHLSAKIDLNRRMSETLEAMARALFKSWFVDFDPVRAKAEGRDPGLPKPIADLFPDRLVDSELGEIPEGWGTASFADTIEIIGGGTPKTSVADYWGGDIPWFSVVDAPTGSQVWVVDTEKKTTRAGIENSSTRVLPAGTTIISARGTVGRIALVGVPMAMNQSCYGLRGRTGKNGFFNYFSTRELVARLQQHAHGSVFDTITRDTLAGVSVVTPQVELIHEYEKRVSPSLERIRTALLDARTLAALRDALLPKLISGVLRVEDGERFLGAA